MAFLDGGWCFGGGRDLGFAMAVTKKLDILVSNGVVTKYGWWSVE